MTTPTKLTPVTPRELDALATIRRRWSQLRSPPTYADVAGAMGVSRPTVFEWAGRLRAKGLLRDGPKLVPVERCPCCGREAPGAAEVTNG